jgi:hypothetical protein
MSHDDFNFEPVKGLPQVLPKGERMIWQGAPRWQDLAIHALHARKVFWYFIALAVVQAIIKLADGLPLQVAAKPVLWLIPMGLIAAAILCGIAYASARTTVYSLTSKRLVMRVGIALPVTINLPFRLVDSASVRLFANGSGDIPLKLNGKERVAYLLLWPHARQFYFAHPQPCLRCVANADHVASLLVGALTGAVGVAVAAAPAKTSQLPLNHEPVAA